MGAVGPTIAALPHLRWHGSAPAAAGPASASRPAQPSVDMGRVLASRVAGLHLTGDPLTDRVVAEHAADPLRTGGMTGAVDRVSAAFTWDPSLGSAQRPIPGSNVAVHPRNSLARFTPDEVRAMSTADVVVRSQSALADALRAGSATGAMAALDAAGPGLQAKLDQKLHRQQELTEALKGARGTAHELPLLVEANKVALQVLLLQRELEKKEALRRLLFALMCGVVPKALIARMVELGMGAIVEQVIEDMVRTGRGISREMSRALNGLRDLGISVHVLPEHLTADAEAEEDARLAAQAAPTRDGRLVDVRGRVVGGGSSDAAASASLLASARGPASA